MAMLAQALDGIVKISYGVEVPLVMVARSFAVAAVVYVVAWLGTYIVLMDGDMTYLGTYFVYSWIGGGEIPAYIQFIAAIFGFVAWVVAYFRMKKAQR